MWFSVSSVSGMIFHYKPPYNCSSSMGYINMINVIDGRSIGFLKVKSCHFKNIDKNKLSQAATEADISLSIEILKLLLTIIMYRVYVVKLFNTLNYELLDYNFSKLNHFTCQTIQSIEETSPKSFFLKFCLNRKFQYFVTISH